MSAQTVTGSGADAPPADLTWLLHRAAQRMRAALDQVARTCGLAGVRDWIVLAALTAEPGRTQLALAHDLGLDKTTLTSLLDRLEAGGLVICTIRRLGGSRLPGRLRAGSAGRAAASARPR